MAITPADIGGDDDLARRILVRARSIAPCIDSFADDSEEQKDAIAILKGVASEAAARGARFVRRQSVGPASVDYGPASSWFHADDISALRALCALSGGGALPVGSFPKPSEQITRMWPEKQA